MEKLYELPDLVEEIRDALRRPLAADAALRTLERGFGRLLSNPFFLARELERMGAAGDEVCLHQDPELDFVVLARGVSARKARHGKSHAVVPHDHGPLWALYGVYAGTTRLQRWEPDAAERGGLFPGLRLLKDTQAVGGDLDAIEPHNMHLPLNPPDAASTIIVVYNKPLPSVLRRGYVPDLERVVEFQGLRPPVKASSKLIRSQPA